MIKENCYLIAELENINEEDCHLKVYRKDLEGNKAELFFEMVNHKHVFQMFVALLDLFGSYEEYLDSKLRDGLGIPQNAYIEDWWKKIQEEELKNE